MKNYLVILLLILPVLNLRSQSYVAAAIPDSLKANADVVVRLDETTVEVKSPSHAVFREHFVYTILNENGDYLATYRTRYDKFISLNYVNAVLYNAEGKEVKRFRKKDMTDHAAESSGTLVNDERLKSGSFYWRNYPYTVEFDEEDETDAILEIPQWTPPRSDKMSCERSIYSITAPKDYKVKYKQLNIDLKPAVTENKGKVTYAWEIRNLPAVKEEPFAARWSAYNPFMLVGPSDFIMEGYTGNMNTWNDYARFYASLQKGRDVLPPEVKQTVHQLTDGIADPARKVAVLYNYLQKNTHYVGIQLGIGGLQPFDAEYVAKNKYGDCKALSNFMKALLKEAGIRGYSVIIKGGENETDFVKDFVGHQFNHVICCVPLGKDTIWLECTDQFLPAGYLSSFTANRYGLMVNDDGGELVHTPAYRLPDNTQDRNIAAVLDETGVLKVQSITQYRAACQDGIEEFIDHYSKEDQLRSLKTAFDLPTYDINEVEYRKDYSGRLPVIRESLQLTVTDYAQVSGKRIFLSPDILTRSRVKLLENETRHFDIEFRNEYRNTDSIQITVPAGYEPEAMPRPVSLESKFGRYEAHAVFEPGKVLYYRSFECYSGRFPKTDYEELVRFYNEIYKSDHARIVLLKKG
jgi:hypothetical protein